MTNWQVTATTIYCDAVDDEITLLVYKDWSAECSGYPKYGNPNKETARSLTRKSQQRQKPLACTGPECHRIVRYKEKLSAEEASKTTEGIKNER
jgi:hypothetical protein